MDFFHPLCVGSSCGIAFTIQAQITTIREPLSRDSRWSFENVHGRVQCKTPVGQYGSKVDIVISVNDSHWDEVKKYDIVDKRTIDGGFEYEVATFTGVQPSYGPMAGGTNITLHGANLNIGSQQVVKVGENLCYIFRIERTSLECSTSAVAMDNVDQELSVALYIDEVQVPFISADNLGSKFSYKPNPVIESIFPDTATFSGNSVVEVRGAHLDSVAKPTMVTHVTSLNHKRSEHITTDCSPTEGGQKMLCPVKPLTESSVLDTTKLEEYQLPIPVRVSFRMDGLRLPTGRSGDGGHFTFVYRPPPQFERFPDTGLDVSLRNPIVQITGKHFDVLKGSKRVFIRVDGRDDVCNITISTTITCVLVTSSLDEMSPHSLEVVYAGEAHPLGALNLVAEESGVNTGIIAGVVVAIFFAALAVVGFLFYRRQQAKKAQPPDYFVDFDNRHVENGLRGGGANSYVAGSEPDARQALIGSSFQLDEETKAMLEAEKLLFKREFLVLGPVIGQGHFGCVYRGTLELEGKGEVQAVAVKTLHNNSRGGEADGQAFLEEALIMKDFHHMNVLPLIGLSIDEGGGLMVIIPYMKYGDLLSYIRDERNWSYGVLLWELMTRGVTPYPEVDNWDIVNFLKQGRRMQQPSFCPDEL
ncbi:hypothetical protein HPB48_000356 [Haemaphysalis longicornis]|uniref:Protein kinase domain-containing protein n=1 Tax=Haemaphysalis longicornis TaxID=44386 RepID=A0A9J6H4G2_HAELO|nr:hypothetical protein HPB48_000356 [Haemaphysalis longicornis]